MRADCVLNRFAAIGELLAHLGCALQGQQRMREGVIAYYVSGLDEFADDIGTLLHIASDHEESGVHVVACQNFQEAKRVGIVGSVIVSEGELFCAARESGEGAAVPLAGRCHRLIASGERGCCGSRSSEYESKHRTNSNGSVGVRDAST